VKHFVIDNGVPEDAMRQLYADATDFRWIYKRSTYAENSNHIINHTVYDVGQFVCPIIAKDHKDEKYFEEKLQPIVDAVQPYIKPIVKIERAKFNLLLKSNEANGRWNMPHFDTDDTTNRKENKWSLIYYVNIADGDTVLFYPHETVRIESKRGRIVLFPANLKHAGSNPKDAFERIVVNIVMETEYEV
jgi:2OG-Fe(II) oxygenase superfamily